MPSDPRIHIVFDVKTPKTDYLKDVGWARDDKFVFATGETVPLEDTPIYDFVKTLMYISGFGNVYSTHTLTANQVRRALGLPDV